MKFNYETAGAIRELLGATRASLLRYPSTETGSLVYQICNPRRLPLKGVPRRFHKVMYANGFLRNDGKFPT